MKRLSFLLSGFAALLLAGCHSEPPQKAELSVTGAQGRALALFEISEEKGAVFVDSLYPSKRHADLYSFPCEERHIYALFFQGTKEPLVLLPMPNEDLRLSTSYSSPVADAEVCEPSASPVNQAGIAYQQRVLQTETQIGLTEQDWILNRYSVKNTDSLHEACTRRIDSLFRAMRQEAMQLCRQHNDNLLPVFIIHKTVANRMLFDMENGQDLAFLKACADSMVKAMPENGHAARLLFNIERAANRLEQDRIFANSGPQQY